MSVIYDNIVEIARKKNKPLCNVEKEANLSTGTISKWKNSDPRYSNLESVAKVLGTTASRLAKKKER